MIERAILDLSVTHRRHEYAMRGERQHTLKTKTPPSPPPPPYFVSAISFISMILWENHHAVRGGSTRRHRGHRCMPWCYWPARAEYVIFLQLWWVVENVDAPFQHVELHKSNVSPRSAMITRQSFVCHGPLTIGGVYVLREDTVGGYVMYLTHLLLYTPTTPYRLLVIDCLIVVWLIDGEIVPSPSLRVANWRRGMPHLPSVFWPERLL